jgi:hypothetical protein
VSRTRLPLRADDSRQVPVLLTAGAATQEAARDLQRCGGGRAGNGRRPAADQTWQSAKQRRIVSLRLTERRRPSQCDCAALVRCMAAFVTQPPHLLHDIGSLQPAAQRKSGSSLRQQRDVQREMSRSLQTAAAYQTLLSSAAEQRDALLLLSPAG